MQAFERQDCQAGTLRENSMLLLYCCDPHYDVWVTGTCCHFSFINNKSAKELLFPIARLFLLSCMDGVKSPCIINVKASAVVKVGTLQCNTVDLFQISALQFSTLYCNFLNTLYRYKLLRNISKIKFNPFISWMMSVCVYSCERLFKCANCSLIFFNFHLNIAMFVCCSKYTVRY
jgi:hypothetical protein